jgi:glycosyltransferase involved in cell wall biosynthesis
MRYNMRSAHFGLLLLTLLLSTSICICTSSPDSKIADHIINGTEKTENQALEQENPIKTTSVLHSIALSSRKYSNSDFADFDISGSTISLIVAVKDYSPRIFPPLVQSLANLREQGQETKMNFEILLAHVGPSDSIQYDTINRLAQLFTPHLRFIGPDPPNQAISLAEAMNKAANLSTGSTLFFTSDMLLDVASSSLLYMSKVVQHPEIGMVAPKLLDASKGDSVIFSAGLDFVLGKNPHKAIWNSWNTDQSGDSGNVASKTDVPFLHYRYQGYLETDSRVKDMQAVYAGSKHGFMISASHWRELNGFDMTLENAYLDADLSLRSRKLFGKTTLYVPQAVVSVTGQDLLMDDSLTGDFAPNELIKADNKRFLEKWVEPLSEQLKSGRLISNLSVVWSMDCGGGQILGFTTEAVNIVMSLQKYVRVKVLNDAAACRSELTKIGFPESTVKMINIMSHRDDREMSTDRFAVVMHKDPRRFDSGYAYNPPDLLIGRSMYETDSIPADWLEPIQAVDFLWVPTAFNRQTFASSGVNSSKIAVVNEAIDLLHFDPSSFSLPASPSSLISTPPELLLDHGKFNFISVFKWEARKDWETLLTAFYDEFSTPEDAENVRLFIRSSMAPENTQALSNFQQRYASEKQRPLSSLPKVIVLSRFVSYTKLPHMYKGAQAYVTATHGEGWGLPIMEAMAMGLPVIATNWSGITEFVTSDTGYLVDYSMISGPQSGHKWAKADLSSLRSAMRRVYSEPSKAAEVGQNARLHLLQRFSADKTAHSIINLITEQIPHFAALKRSRPTHSFSYGRNRYNMDSPPSSYSTHHTPNPRSPPVSNIWSTSTTVEKHGQTLTKAKLTE